MLDEIPDVGNEIEIGRQVLVEGILHYFFFLQKPSILFCQ